METQPLLERIQQMVQPILAAAEMELVDIEFKREGRDWCLRLFIDKVGGVTLDDCADISREVGTLLEVEDPIPSAFHLEISSPGLDRPLKRREDFERFRGELIKLKTYEKLDPDGRGYERKTFVGILLGLQGETVSIEQNDKAGGVATFQYTQIAKANLEPTF